MELILTVGAACVALIAIITLGKIIWTAVVNISTTHQSVNKQSKEIDHIQALLQQELKPNGGTSLKDQIGRLEKWTIEHDGVHKGLNQIFGNR